MSIVVASMSGVAELQACIDALVPPCREANVELVVVRATTAEEFRALQSRNPAVLFMPAPDGSTSRALRGFGIAAADGDIVALTDDARLPDAEWLRDTVALAAPAPAS